jgi:hypothetical protein
MTPQQRRHYWMLIILVALLMNFGFRVDKLNSGLQMLLGFTMSYAIYRLVKWIYPKPVDNEDNE